MSFRPNWTADEVAVLRARYESEGPVPIADDIGRTWRAVHRKARRLGLYRNRPWATADENLLRNIWGEVSLEEAAARLGRSQEALIVRAEILGIGGACPRGREYLSVAAKRTGYAVCQLREILKAAGVAITPALASPRSTRKNFYFVVDPFDVDEAVKKWLSSETLATAARKRGVHTRYLSRRLRRLDGVPKKPSRGKHWRIPTAVIDRALAIGVAA